MNKPKKVALAYSGGLDTSVIIPWLKENYGCEVVAVCGDIGQGGDELTGLEEKARQTGASEVYIEDMREEFVSQYRSEEHTSELQSHSFISYAVFCLKQKK